MAKKPMPPRNINDFSKEKQENFVSWLVEHGAEMLEPSNQYEVFRVRVNVGHKKRLHILYQKANGSITWTKPLSQAYREQGNPHWKGFQRTYGRGYTARKLLERIVERDGPECFYCGIEPEEQTLEHLLSNCHGGSNRIENLAMACKSCNEMAGTMSVVDKVKLRENQRSQRKRND